MRNWTMAFMPVVMAATAAACSSADSRANGPAPDRTADAGPRVERDFALAGFTMVDAAGPDDVTIREGAEFSIVATGPQSEIDKLDIRLDGKTLEIGRKHEKLRFGSRDHEAVSIAITMPRLEGLRLTGSGNVVADSIEGDDVEVALTGSGDLKLASLAGTRARIAIAGSGNIAMGGGSIESGKLDISGSGNIDAEAVKAADLAISILGSGDVDAHASRTAKVSILGSGDVVLSGGASCTKREMGSGKLTCS